jgi:hypothetical protein
MAADISRIYPPLILIVKVILYIMIMSHILVIRYEQVGSRLICFSLISISLVMSKRFFAFILMILRFRPMN